MPLIKTWEKCIGCMLCCTVLNTANYVNITPYLRLADSIFGDADVMFMSD